MKTISIKVPNWFPSSYDLRQYKRRFTMWLFPPRCKDCNTRVKSSTFFWKQRNRVGTHPLGVKNTMGDFAIRSNKRLCAGCMKKYLHQHPKDTGNCTICGTKNVPVMGYMFTKEPANTTTFLWHWWNAGQFCMQCIDELLDKGEPATDTYTIKTINGKRVTVPDFY